MSVADKHQVIVVGGGAGGLELATRIGGKFGRRQAEVTLIDVSPTHIWKPLLHDVAAGTLDANVDALEYLAQARWHRFRFRLGRMEGLDRKKCEVYVAPTYDDKGVEAIPRRSFHYDTLVIAVGSVSNDFGVKGVQEHCLFLDTTEQAELFRRRMLGAVVRAQAKGGPQTLAELHVVIVGGGATGSELAAQLHHVAYQLSAYGLDQIVPERDIKISLLEAADRILPVLPPRLSAAAEAQLARLGIAVHVSERVVEVTAQGVRTQSGKFIPTGITVWAAGIKAPDFLKALDGLETTRLNQLVVGRTLQTTRDDAVFAFGDCAACPLDDNQDRIVPPRAQAAHQQASLLVRSLRNRFRGRPLAHYVYRDYGSLVALGKYSTVGSLMNRLFRGSIMIEGVIARLVYLSLYKMHQVALFGWYRVVLLTLANLLRRRVYPEIKLH
ncbi:MAG: NAD(P)/FAD-dependent oxidoreductase [Acidiferrobacterales bacterium]